MSSLGKSTGVSVNELMYQLLSRSPKESSFVDSAPAIAGSPLENRDEKRSRIAELGRRALPDYPGLSYVPQVVMKPPALPRPSDSELDWARMLAASYRTACKYRYGMNSSFFQFGKLTLNTAYPTLRTAADKFIHFKIPPLAWCLFSFDVWRETVPAAGETSPPTVAWTFASSRIATRRTWFEERREEYCVQRVKTVPKHVELIQDWEQMWQALLARDPKTRMEVLSVVEQFFPGDSFEKRVLSAKTEAVSMQREVDEVVLSGGGLWG